MNPEESNKRIKAERFFRSSRSRFGFGSGRLRYGNIRTISGIVPKRPLPDEIVSKISKESQGDIDQEATISPNKTTISSLGRVTLDLVQISDNLNKIKEVIEEDYKQTKDTNKKEIEDYRIRISNRGRKLSKKDLGDDKKNITDIIKPFVSGFFSGAGGAIRALAAFNLIEAFLNGDYTKVFKSLLGIGITFIPQISTMIAGAILKALLKGFGKRMFGGAGRGIRPGGMGGGGLGGIGKFGAALSLGAGALALGNSFASSQEESPDQTRLQELTAEQKALTDKGLVSITQEDLKKFQDLNNKFEKTLDILLGKVPPGGAGAQSRTGGSAAGAEISNAPVNMDTSMRGSVEGKQFNNAELVALAKRVGATDEEAVRLAAIAKYESSGRSGALNDNPNTGDLSYGLWQINMIGNLGPARRREFGISSNEQLFDPVTNAQAALKTLRSSGWGAWTTNSKVTPNDLQRGRKDLRSISTPTTQPAQPASSRRGADQVSATPSTGRQVAILPIPQMMGGDSPGAFNNNGTETVASIDAKNPTDYYSGRFAWNIMDVG